MTRDHAMLWRRLDGPGHDAARLIESAAGIVLEGTAVFSEDGEPCRLDYRVDCDPQWRTVATRVMGWYGEHNVDVHIVVSADRRWLFNGQPCPAVERCDDVDLSFTPATNLLAIRRLQLPLGGRSSVRAAWLRFPEPALEPLNQTYQRRGDHLYHYQSGEFVALLETNPIGFVTHYPEFWRRETPGDAGF